jgi:hypothetical protein
MLLDTDGEDRHRGILGDLVEHAMVADSRLLRGHRIRSQPLPAPALDVRVDRQVHSDRFHKDRAQRAKLLQEFQNIPDVAGNLMWGTTADNPTPRWILIESNRSTASSSEAGGRPMDPVENVRATAQVRIALGRQEGLDLEPLRDDFSFKTNKRWVYFWRKRDDLPCTCRPEEKEGTLHYNMEGSISVLPDYLKASAELFRGGWSEAGIFDNLEQAFELLKAWLIDRKKVDDLPSRHVRRSQMC